MLTLPSLENGDPGDPLLRERLLVRVPERADGRQAKVFCVFFSFSNSGEHRLRGFLLFLVPCFTACRGILHASDLSSYLTACGRGDLVSGFSGTFRIPSPLLFTFFCPLLSPPASVAHACLCGSLPVLAPTCTQTSAVGVSTAEEKADRVIKDTSPTDLL